MEWQDRFQALDTWLAQYQAVWREKPFTRLECDWEADYPELAQWLRQRSLADAEAVHTSLALPDAPAPLPELLATAARLSAVPDWSPVPGDTWPELLERHIPGRKWQQIQTFAAAAQNHWQQPGKHILDWCAGKGHLGRLLAWQGDLPLTCLEHDLALVAAGAELSRSLQLSAEHHCQDVLQPSAWCYLKPQHTVVALHACGDLHTTLLQQVAEQGCRQLALSPCCYNRIRTEHYQPLSDIARQASLQLTREDLALPLQAAVTAGRRDRRLRDQSMAWRLGFDLWQREARGIDDYLPTPSRPQSALQQSFADFCQGLARHHQLDLLPPADWTMLEHAGWQRLAEVRNLELLRAVFRRPLEIWLMLDRLLWLEQSGYSVQLGQFCPETLTPRNLLLIAER
ncbi:methyltransferase [Halopseudomonas salegens]|uniref:Methyltransferase domain-containing protein n=1 Tax=Halopseudomonas salegens TaxID=1434072 RepID=A0A1H2E4A3_9GAMM|nr:methyltransferase [Halopseudomonas salegens]SDT89819.1 Methyltransferase domain-containing protein [Halopseudomonas salegens]